MFSNESQQFLVRFAVYRRRLHPRQPAAIVKLLKPALSGIGFDFDPQNFQGARF